MNYEPPAVIRRIRELPPRHEAPPKSVRTDPFPHIPFSEGEEFLGWPIALGVMLSAGLCCWGLYNIMLWLGRAV